MSWLLWLACGGTPEKPTAPADPAVAACSERWSVPAEAIQVDWLEEGVFSAQTRRDEEDLRVLGVVEEGRVRWGPEAAQAALLQAWTARPPDPIEAADDLARVLGLESVQRVTEKMPADLFLPRSSTIEGQPAIEFCASNAEDAYFRITVLLGEAPEVRQVRL